MDIIYLSSLHKSYILLGDNLSGGERRRLLERTPDARSSIIHASGTWQQQLG
jgi:hypothetical protein